MCKSRPQIAGILETCLYVRDLPVARRFYEVVLGLAAIFEEERMCVYDVAPSSVLILFREGATLKPVATPGGIIPPHDGTGPAHLAFRIAAEEWDRWRDHLAAYEIVIESAVDWPKGGRSLYVRDPDRHAIELATPGLWPNDPISLR